MMIERSFGVEATFQAAVRECLATRVMMPRMSMTVCASGRTFSNKYLGRYLTAVVFGCLIIIWKVQERAMQGMKINGGLQFAERLII